METVSDQKEPLLKDSNKAETKNENHQDIVEVNDGKKNIRDNLLGAMFISLQTVLYAGCSLYQRYAFEYRPELTFAKTSISIGIAVMVLSYYLMRKTNSSFSYDSSTNKILFLRVLTSMGSDALVFFAGKYARLGTISCIMQSYPIFTCIIQGLILKTYTSLLDYIMLIGCLLGSLLIIKPFTDNGGADSNLGLFIGLMALIMMCSTLIFNRYIEHNTSIYTMNFYCGVAFLLLGVMLSIINQESMHIASDGIFLLIAVGIGYSMSRFLYNVGLTLGDYSYILPFDNLTLLFSTLFGYLILHDKFDSLDLIGTSIIAAICVYKSMLNQ